jgi:hypothetical protein
MLPKCQVPLKISLMCQCTAKVGTVERRAPTVGISKHLLPQLFSCMVVMTGSLGHN